MPDTNTEEVVEEKVEAIDFTDIPATLVITNNTDHAVQLPLYPDNSIFTLNAGDVLVYEVNTSREYMFYYINCRSLGLSIEEGEPNEEDLEKALIDLRNIDKANLLITNKTEDVIGLTMYSDNAVFNLNPGEAIKYKAESAREAMYYYIAATQAGLAFEIE